MAILLHPVSRREIRGEIETSVSKQPQDGKRFYQPEAGQYGCEAKDYYMQYDCGDTMCS